MLVVGWIAAAVAATAFLPSFGEARGGALGSLVPADAEAVETQIRSARLFRLPLLANTLVVQRDPNGLTAEAQSKVFERAVKIARREYPDLLSVPFALPATNTLALFPASSEDSTTAITYLYFEGDVGLVARDRLAHWFTDRRFDSSDSLVGVTGVVPARVEQGRLIEAALPLVELATIVLIAAVIGLTFRGLLAPVLTLTAVALSYLVALRAVGAVGERIGVAAPRELQPIVLVLLLGLVTDYCIFFLSGFRHRLQAGERRVAAAIATTREFAPIVATAGLIVAGGSASLVVADVEFFRVFGPALAVTVLVALAVSLTFVPAMLAVFGAALYWPGGVARRPPEHRRRQERRLARMVGTRRRAVTLVAVVSALLLLASTGVARTELALTPIRGLPDDSEPARAAAAAADGFAPGIVSPTLLLVEAPLVTSRRAALADLQDLIVDQPGVAGVLGPADLPAKVPLGAVLSPDRSAARYVLVLDREPHGSASIDLLDDLRARMPRLLAEAGLAEASFSFGGNTAIAAETVDAIVRDLFRIGGAVLLVNLVFLVAFLRSLLGPLYLLGASVLALAATLGLTTYAFILVGHGDQLTYYVPFMAAVLLVSLGSDYNVFLVGRIWQEARRRPLAEATIVAAPRASTAITVAAVALALSFALLALVPLASFREFAVAMAIGVVLDAFVVRSLLVPALVSAVGRASAWPGPAGRTHGAAGGSRQ